MSDTTGKAYFGGVEASEEELKAFHKAYSLHELDQRQQDIIMGSCLAAFLTGYRTSERDNRAKWMNLARDLKETRSDLAAELEYPHEWDMDKFPSLESAALLHIKAQHKANPAILKAREQLAKELKYPEEWDTAAYPTLEEALVEAVGTSKLPDEERRYSMNQMRDYADGMLQTRYHFMGGRLKIVAEEWDKLATKLYQRNTTVSNAEAAAMRNNARELRGTLKGVRASLTHSFQLRAAEWAVKCFGAELGLNVQERNHRFFEEAAELVQACGMTKAEAIAAIDYVFGRPIGDKRQEIGGLMTTLAVLCHVHDIDMFEAAEVDLLEISVPEKREAIAAKRMTKPNFAAQMKEQPGFSTSDFLELVKEHSPIIAELLTGNKAFAGRYLSQEGKMLFDLLKTVMEKIKK